MFSGDPAVVVFWTVVGVVVAAVVRDDVVVGEGIAVVAAVVTDVLDLSPSSTGCLASPDLGTSSTMMTMMAMTQHIRIMAMTKVTIRLAFWLILWE